MRYKMTSQTYFIVIVLAKKYSRLLGFTKTKKLNRVRKKELRSDCIRVKF